MKRHESIFWSTLLALAFIVAVTTLFAGAAAAQTLAVDSPNGGEAWTAGSSHTIRWTEDGLSGPTVDIELLAAGAPTVPATIIATGAPNTGSFLWDVPAALAPGASYSILVTPAAAPADASDGPFTVNPPVAQMVTLPAGGEWWRGGEVHAITWDSGSFDGTTLAIDLHKGGAPYSSIAASAPNNGSFLWTVPAGVVPGADYFVQITTLTNSTGSGQFSITQELDVLSPDGGEQWTAGSSHTVSWTTAGLSGSTVDIELLKAGFPTVPATIIASGAPNTGALPWTIPDSLTAGADYAVRVTVGSLPADVSAAPFAISPPVLRVVSSPSGGESWFGGDLQVIAWDHGSIDGATVDIDLYQKEPGGTLHALASPIATNVPNNGSFAWVIPVSTLTGAEYLVKVKGHTNSASFAYSDNYFSITSVQGTAAVTSPAGGELWLGGESRTITWAGVSGSSVTIDLFKGGALDSAIAIGVPNTGSFSWTVPAELVSSADYLVRVTGLTLAVPTEPASFAFSPNSFSIMQNLLRVTSPNGGETWAAGAPHEITWTSEGPVGADLRIDLYKGGALFSNIVTSTASAAGSYTWDIPGGHLPGTDYRVRLTSVASPSIHAASFSGFEIAFVGGGGAAPAVTAPAGGELWLGGEQRTITWSNINGTSVTIDLFKGGARHSAIGINVPNTGSFTWTVPAAVGSDADYLVKVTGLTDAEPTAPASFAFSPNQFSIMQNLLRVTSPNGGETWAAGAPHDITWSTEGAVGANLRIDLYKGGALFSNIAVSTASAAGSYTWDIPGGHLPGTDYQVRLTSVTNPSIHAASFSSFEIAYVGGGGVAPAVTAPTGGELWLGGEQRTITWSNINGTSVNIDLYRGGTLDAAIGVNVPNTGAFAWMVPAGVASSADYLVKVTGLMDTEPTEPPSFAYSPNSFSIMQNLLRVTSPNGGEKWAAGAPHEITWSVEGPVGANLRIDLYKGGALFSNIVASTPVLGGSYTWDIPGGHLPGTDYQVRLTSVADPSIHATSFGSFEIAFVGGGGAAPVVTAPAGGELWRGGEVHTITWSNIDGTSVDIDLYKGQQDQPGPEFDSIVARNVPNTGSFSWVVPSTLISDADYLVKVTGLTDTEPTAPASFAFSDNYFSIMQTLLRVTSPNGGEKWAAGASHQITWSTEGAVGANLRIDLYKGGALFSNIVAAASSVAGSYSWDIPGGHLPGTDYQVRLTSVTNPSIHAASFGSFEIAYVGGGGAAPAVTAPTGGELWRGGEQHVIRWTNVNGTSVNVDLLQGGAVVTAIGMNVPNTGAFSWTIPASVASSADYLVKVTGLTDTVPTEPPSFAYSANRFTIVQNRLLVTSPNGGEKWAAGSSYDIAWLGEGAVGADVRIDLYKGGALFANIVAATPAADGSYTWAIPAGHLAAADYRVRVSAVANPGISAASFADFEIVSVGGGGGNRAPVVTFPNGGETWAPGSTHTILWTNDGNTDPTVRIDLYKAGAFNRTIAAAAANGGSHSWTVPLAQQPGTDYRVHVISTSDPLLYGASFADFRIAEYQPTVLAPNGGESWAGGTTHAIAWEEQGNDGSNVDIDLFKGGAFDSSIAMNVPNLGSFLWTVPRWLPADADYKVKISSVSNPFVFAQSGNFFAITQDAIAVESPNGGEHWYAGSTQAISWSAPAGAGPDVRIDLYRGTTLNTVIAASTPNDGSHSWTIRNEQAAGLDYTVRVTSLAIPDLVGKSAGPFEIRVSAPLDLTISSSSTTVYLPAGSLVGTLATVDPNPGDTFTYQLVGGADSDAFQVVGDALRTAQVFTAVGSRQVTIRSTDQTGLFKEKSFTIAVTGPNQPPTDITLSNTLVATNQPAGTPVGLLSTADPNPDDVFIYTLVAGPGDTDNGDFFISGNDLKTAVIFTNNTAVNKNVRVRSTDKGLLAKEKIFAITVGANTPPELNPIGNKVVNRGALLQFEILALDQDGDTLGYSATGVPAGATFVGRTFTWTPAVEDVGDHVVHFEVTDGKATDFEDVTITVTNLNPVLFSDRFTDGTAAGDPQWVQAAGTWLVDSTKHYRTGSTALTSLSTVRGAVLPAISAGRLEVDLNVQNLAPSPNAMVVFSYRGVGKYRYVQLVPGSGFVGSELRLGQVGDFGGRTTGVYARTGVSATVAAKYHVRVDAYANGTVKVWFGNTPDAPPALTYRFPTAVAGRVGLGAVKSGAWFDNVKVSDTSVLTRAVEAAAAEPGQE